MKRTQLGPMQPLDTTIPDPALIVMIGAAGSGKSTWASTWPSTQFLELDHFRALVSDEPGDQEATTDAAAVLRTVLEARLAGKKTTVIDATNTETAARAGLLQTARARMHHPYGPVATALAAAAVPAAGWAAHGLVWHRRKTEASRDPLTGAWRRDEWEPRNQQCLDRHKNNALVLVCDIDHFKALNDTWGHYAGDMILQATAARLQDWAGDHGVVGRLGGEAGDEFVVAARVGAARRTLRLERLQQVLRQPVPISDEERADVAVSLGAASPEAIGTYDRGRLLRAADVAMFEGKHGGRIILATREHADAPSINGRRPGRSGTHAAPVAA